MMDSTARARVLSKNQKHRVRDRLSPSATLPGCSIYTPIEDWSNDDVWMFLMQVPNAWGYSNKDLLGMYAGASADGECPLVVDTSTPSGRMLFQMLAVFAEFERAIITSRINAGLARARAKGVTFGRPNLSLDRRTKVQKALIDGLSIRQVAKATGVSTASVQRIKRSMKTVEDDRQPTVEHQQHHAQPRAENGGQTLHAIL